MILATSEDIDYPHIDWHCRECGEVYCSAGYPPETRCTSGHGAGWRPQDEQMEDYIDLLESLEVGDGVLFAGHGPAPLMAPVFETGENYLVTESIDWPSREMTWDRDELEIFQAKVSDGHARHDRVYHVDTVEVMVEA